MKDSDIGYESGQLSIIEGQQAVTNAPNIVRNLIKAKNGINLNNGGAMEAINAATGTIKGLADNQGTRQTNYDANGSVGKKGAKNASANNNFYANIGVNAGISKSKSTSNSHTESAVVTTMRNSSITYNNVNNITYQGTQAQGGKFIYNNVANIQKEAVELHNSYTSSSSSRGINAGATIGYGHKIQTTGNGGSISVSRSNQNTVETIHANGSFTNVNEVHNNTGTMTLSGFNQEGGKVTGNIGKVEVVSRQNTSTTTGSSKGVNLGISANGVPSSVTINASKTNGNRAFVDNQSTFVVGEGSNLHVGTVENTGAVIGKEGNSTFKIDSYVGKDIQNYDTMKTVGITAGTDGSGVNYENSVKEGITRNTVIGSPEIGRAEGAPINTDISKANETTREEHRKTNVFLESQTIDYILNSKKFIEDINIARVEVDNKSKSVNEFIDKVKKNLGLSENDELEIIYVNKNSNTAKATDNIPVITEDHGLNYIKSVKDGDKVVYGKDEKGNIIYAKDRSKEDFSKDRIDGNKIKLYVKENNKFEVYDTKNKILYLSLEAAQLDILDVMNVISSDPDFNKEIVAAISYETVYKGDKKEKMTTYLFKKVHSVNESNGVIPTAINRVQGVHTHGAKNDYTDKNRKTYATEVFSKSDIDWAIDYKIPLSVATPGDSKYSSEFQSPKVYIFYPETGEIHYFGEPEVYEKDKEKIDKSRFNVIRKNSTVRIEPKKGR